MFCKDNIDKYLFQLAKLIQNDMQHVTVDLTLVGGASLINFFNIRESTLDIDVIKNRSVDLRDFILRIEEENNLPHNWLNDDVMFSKSFKPSLLRHKVFYKTFCNCLNVYYLSPVALLCMKIKAWRLERSDVLDAFQLYFKQELIDDEVELLYKELYGDDTNLKQFLMFIRLFKKYFERYDIPEDMRMVELVRLYSLGDLKDTLTMLTT